MYDFCYLKILRGCMFIEKIVMYGLMDCVSKFLKYLENCDCFYWFLKLYYCVINYRFYILYFIILYNDICN